MNVDLLQKIKAEIVAEPDAFRMDVWTCGTAHCIAGWAIKLSGLAFDSPIDGAPFESVGGRRASDVAAGLLSINAAEADALFLVTQWPDSLATAYEQVVSDTPDARQQRAVIAAEVIDTAVAHGSIDWVRERDDEDDDDYGWDDDDNDDGDDW